jgi:hypothetical protein
VLLFSVTNDEFLQQRPTDRHLQRLSLEYNIYEVRTIMVFSGLPYADWKELYISTKLSDGPMAFLLQNIFGLFHFAIL